MSNELVVANETKAVSITQTMSDVGISAQDLIIPKLLLMQNTSEYVGDGKAQMGDVLNSQTLEKLGSINEPVNIVPLKLYKTWRVYDMSGRTPTFLRQDPVTPGSERLPWEDNENGMPIRRDLCMNYFVLLTKELESGDAFPMIVSFKRTSMQAGKVLSSHIFKLAYLKRPPFSQSVPLKISRQKKETNTYAVFEIGKGTDLSDAMKEAASKWLEVLSTMNYKVDESDEEKVQGVINRASSAVVIDDKTVPGIPMPVMQDNADLPF